MSRLMAQITSEVVAAMEGGPPVLVATVIAAPPGTSLRPGAKLLVRADGSSLGALDSGAIGAAVLAEAPDAFRRQSTEVLYLSPGGEHLSRHEAESRLSCAVMLEVHSRPDRLLIVGGGHIGKALAAIASLCRFTIEVVDDRPAYASAERFPEADRITCGPFDEVLTNYDIGPNTYVVLVTRGHKHDEASLGLVVASAAAYIGMIGSKRRVSTVLNRLIEQGKDPDAVARVHSPVGLAIGAETPEEIAVAIMAEIIQTRSGNRMGRGR